MYLRRSGIIEQTLIGTSLFWLPTVAMVQILLEAI